MVGRRTRYAGNRTGRTRITLSPSTGGVCADNAKTIDERRLRRNRPMTIAATATEKPEPLDECVTRGSTKRTKSALYVYRRRSRRDFIYSKRVSVPTPARIDRTDGNEHYSVRNVRSVSSLCCESITHQRKIPGRIRRKKGWVGAVILRLIVSGAVHE